MQHHDIRFEIKEVRDTGTFMGYGSVYGNIDQGDDIVEKGCFADSLLDHNQKGTMPAMLWQHRSGEPIGSYQKMMEDSNGLLVEGKLALKVQRGAEAYELLQAKAISGLSIGFQTKESTYDQKTGIRTITKGDLWEVSLVTFPMNDSARISAVKAIEDMKTIRDVEDWLRDSYQLTRSERVAVVSRIKSLVLRDSSADADAVVAALKNRITILNS
jgi:uncharacterized protein